MTTDRKSLHTMFGAILLILSAVSESISDPTSPMIYTVYTGEHLTWYEAAQFCRSRNETLAKVHNEIVASTLKGFKGWIGLHKSASGDYRWMDCTSLGDYQPWGEYDRDSKDDDDCVKFYKSRWLELHCNYQYYAICETSGDECSFTTYEKKIPARDPSFVISQKQNSEDNCKTACLSYYKNSQECIGYVYSNTPLRGVCELYAAANLSVQLPMDDGQWSTSVKTCFTVHVNSDVIEDDIGVITITDCEETTEIVNVSMATENPSKNVKTENPTISTAPMEEIGGGPQYIIDDFGDADAKFDSSPQEDISTETKNEENDRTGVPTTTVEVTSSAKSDGLTTTAESNLGSSQVDVAMTTETPAVTNSNMESTTTMCSCPCPRAQPTNITTTIEEIFKALHVQTSTLSSFRRKKESAKDERPSAQAVGQVGVALLAATGVLILLFDADILIKFVKNRFGPRKPLAI